MRNKLIKISGLILRSAPLRVINSLIPISDNEYIIPIWVVPYASNFPRNFSSAGVNGESSASDFALSVSFATGSACSLRLFNACLIIYSRYTFTFINMCVKYYIQICAYKQIQLCIYTFIYILYIILYICIICIYIHLHL